jgi:hypothetical protein
MSNRKTRADAWNADLPDEFQLEIYQRLKADGYQRTRTWLFTEHGIGVSIGALSNAHKKWAEADSEARILRSKIEAENVLSTIGDGEAADMTNAYDLALTQLAFDWVMGGKDPEDITRIASIVDRRAKQRLDERRIDQAEQSLALKVRQYEDQIAAAKNELTKAKADGGLDLETIERIEQQLNML